MHDQGYTYDEVYPGNWAEEKVKGMEDGSVPFGQLPKFVDEDGTVAVQSGAILRHLGRKFKLYGADDTEALKIDIILEEIADWRRAYGKLVYEHSLGEEQTKAYKATLADRFARGGGYLGHIEAFAKAHGGPFLTGANVSIADFALFDLLDTHLRSQFMPGLFEEYPVPTLKAWHGAMAARPGVAAYLASGATHREKANGNGLA